jgi:lipopolysaccharide/colanic/teichoic acid biosynthesis glycosyltransferase
MPPATAPATVCRTVSLPILPSTAAARTGEGTVRIAAVTRERMSRRCRLLNVAIAAIALVLLLPLMAFIALAIGLTSRGPILFRQTRIGIDRRRPGPHNLLWRRTIDYGGKPFVMYKFRTMRHTPTASAVWAGRNDPRVTFIGRFLRAHRLDELPQLVNVLRGEMNIVGPRPEQPEIFQELRGQIRKYPVRQQVLPGITGLAQVSQPYDQSIDDVRRKLIFDLEYIRRRSLMQDLQIMARTMPVMVGRKGGW